MKLKTVLSSALIFFSLNTNATLVDGGNYIQDTNTKLDWLKMSFTKGKSFDEISTLITTDPFYSGYQIANRFQVKTLFNNYYGSDILPKGSTSDDLDYLKTYKFIQLLGMTREIQDSFVAGVTKSADQYHIHGYVSEAFGASKHYVIKFQAFDFLIETNLTDEGRFYYQHSNFNDNVANDYIGGYLVRSAITPIPEPSTYALMSLGILSLIGLHYRRRQYVA